MRNPNGYGSVIRLHGNRRRPFMVRKTAGFNEKGHPIYQIIGYTATREEGQILLAQYNNDPWDVEAVKITLGQLHDLWLQKRAPKLSRSLRNNLAQGWNYVAPLSAMPYRSIKAIHMQDCIDSCAKGPSTLANIKNLWAHLDRFALEMDIATRQYSQLLTVPQRGETTRTPITPQQIDECWARQSEPFMDIALILIYSGWRISELLSLKQSDVNLTDGTMKGGTKTAAGKNRIVPIHSLIRPFIEARMDGQSDWLIHRQDGTKLSDPAFRERWKNLGLEKNPHECRHTFETLLDNAGANRRCIDLMMGHTSKDTGNRVYNHKTIADLKAAIELVTR